jgi:hypothetical protein
MSMHSCRFPIGVMLGEITEVGLAYWDFLLINPLRFVDAGSPDYSNYIAQRIALTRP